jgi:two-component system sensor histidine kinase MtrB
VAVAVRDYGIGLGPGEDRLVFDRFWRADPARARTTGGTGLGLAIALEDARIHGGWLEAWGEVGRGSVFRLTLPRAAGVELAGSPLPLGPDEAELADRPTSTGPAATNGPVAAPARAMSPSGASGAGAAGPAATNGPVAPARATSPSGANGAGAAGPSGANGLVVAPARANGAGTTARTATAGPDQAAEPATHVESGGR